MLPKVLSVPSVFAALAPSLVAAQGWDAYLACNIRTSCYVAQGGCSSDTAGGLSFTLYDGGRRAVIEGLSPQPLTVTASESNVYRIRAGQGFWVVVLDDDWSGYTQLLSVPEYGDAGVVVGDCQRANGR